jgi:AhpD family alkylhydroperoxidase
MNTLILTVRNLVLCSALAWAAAGVPALAEDSSEAEAKTYREVEDTFGKVPDFVKAFPKNAFPGAWKEIKAIEFADGALTVKEKSLIALAVAAQIPCHYCVWADTFTARRSGATEDQIKEAVAVSALERHWSTVFNGMQVDFEQFKKDYGGE